VGKRQATSNKQGLDQTWVILPKNKKNRQAKGERKGEGEKKKKGHNGSENGRERGGGEKEREDKQVSSWLSMYRFCFCCFWIPCLCAYVA
jgi:hypothetical protein